jgi:MinD-like ATPase involved in chromosome partitioning or flagellar assembly
MFSLLHKRSKKNNPPELWAMKPELYPQIISNFRAMKNIIILNHQKKMMKIFLITGPERKVGVSTIAFNISIVCGWDMPERRVLMIDANVSYPALHHSFSIRNTPGLADFLYGKALLKEVIYKSNVDNLDIIPFGEKNENFPSPFTREIFFNFIQSIKNKYDFIFIDSEPSITSGYTQSILSKTDGVIIIVKNGTTRLESINETITQMYNNEIPVIGSFLNFKKKIIPNFIIKYI